MKKILSLLSLAALTVGLLGSCSKLNERIDSLEKRIDGIENTQIASVGQQITAINASINDLKAADATINGKITELKTTAEAQQTLIDALKEADQALGQKDAALEARIATLEGQVVTINSQIKTLEDADKAINVRIDELKSYIDTGLGKAKDWAAATFATLAQYQQTADDLAALSVTVTGISTTLAGVQTSIAALDTKIDGIDAALQGKITDAKTELEGKITALKTELEGKIAEAISTSETGLQSWVNEQLSAYYTAAQMDAKITGLQAEINALKIDTDANKTKIEELETELDQLTQALEEAKTTIKTEYEAAIATAINEYNGTITQTIQTKIDEVNATITALTGRVEALETTVGVLSGRMDAVEASIATIGQQIAAINQSISDLETIRTNIQTLIDAKTGMEDDIKALKAADQALEGKITDLKNYVDTELANYATTEWANATFATLAKQEEIIADVAKLKQDLEGLDTKLDQAVADIKANLDKAIADIETSLKEWVNEQLTGYYTTAQIDAKIAELQSAIDALEGDNETNKSKIEELETELTQLTQALEDAKTTIKEEYEAAIATAIEEYNGTITQTIQTKIDEVNSTINDLTVRFENLEFNVIQLTGRVEDLEEMIQTVSIIPAYNDGSVKVENDSLTINCVITPKEAVINLEKEDFTILVSEVLTKSALYQKLTIASDTDLVLDETNGAATIKVDVSSVLPEDEGKALTVAVNIKNGISDYTTEFVPVYVAPAPAPVVPKGFVDLGVKDANGKPLYWAEKNLGASKPEEYGTYFSWGETGVGRSATTSGNPFSTKSFSWDNDVFGQTFQTVAQNTACPNGILAQTYDVAYQTNNAWRMPTKEDFTELAKQCFLEWTENYNSTGVKGMIVWKAKSGDDGWFKTSTNGKGRKIKDDGSGYKTAEDHTFSNTYAIGTDPCVFFPAAGYGDGTVLIGAGSNCYYWSSSLNTGSTDNAYRIGFSSSSVFPQNSNGRYYGYSVRPVAIESSDSKPVVPVTGVTLDKTELSLMVGNSETLKATVQPADATNKNVIWSSDNTAVARVGSTDGKVTALAEGTATITAIVDGLYTATCTVTVAEPERRTVVIDWGTLAQVITENEDTVIWFADPITVMNEKATSTSKANAWIGGKNSNTYTTIYTNQKLTLSASANLQIDSLQFTYPNAYSYGAWESSTNWTNVDTKSLSADKKVATVRTKDGNLPLIAIPDGNAKASQITVFYH